MDATLSGGTWGAAIGGVLMSGMGGVGAFLMALGGLLFSLQVCFEIRWSAVAQTMAGSVPRAAPLQQVPRR